MDQEIGEVVKNLSEDGKSSGDEEILEGEENKFAWSIRKRVLLLTLSLVYIVSFTALFLLSPFFPNVAVDKGVSITMVGIIFAAYSLVAGVFSLVCPMLIVKWGGKRVVMVGLVLSGTCQLLFGLCNVLEDKTSFAATFLVLRAVSALGGAACETAVYSVAISGFPKHTSTIVGILECCCGIGTLVGPAFGGILYDAGGFPLPFVVTATLMFALLPVTQLTLPTNGVSVATYNLHLAWRLVKIFPFLVTVICLFVSAAIMAILEPIFSLHLQKVFGINATGAGLLFLLMSLSYVIASLIMGWISDKSNCYRIMMATGFAGAAVGYFLIGPVPFFDFILPKESLGLVCIALFVIGLFCGMLFVPAIPDMLQSAVEHGVPNDETTSAAVAGFFNSMANFGPLAGFLLAGSLNQSLGFQWTTTIVAVICGFQAILLVMLTVCESQKLYRLSNWSGAEKKSAHLYQVLKASSK